MDRDIRLALLGDHEAAKRLTDAGVLMPCMCGRTPKEHGPEDWKQIGRASCRERV